MQMAMKIVEMRIMLCEGPQVHGHWLKGKCEKSFAHLSFASPRRCELSINVDSND
jgi:hypothetical protein